MSSKKQVMQVEREFAELYQRCQPFTMCDLLKCHNLYKAVCYITQAGIEGALVECGVWRGGCSMIMAMTASLRSASDREIHLYDTFAGMTEPTEADVKFTGESAEPTWHEKQNGDHNEWCYASLEEVQSNMASTGYPSERVRYIQGPVEQTIPELLPDRIALLRLDTDFYESTWHELEHLYPRLAPGGVLILDDYNYWQGQRSAAIEYFADKGVHIMLTFVSTSATGVKVPPHGLTRREREARKAGQQVDPRMGVAVA